MRGSTRDVNNETAILELLAIAPTKAIKGIVNHHKGGDAWKKMKWLKNKLLTEKVYDTEVCLMFRCLNV